MPKLSNVYWICGRCNHREKRPPRGPLTDFRQYTMDTFTGDLIYHKVKDKCSRCGCQNNLRYFVDASVPHNDQVYATRDGERVGNCDPWSGREIEEELRAANGH